MLRVDLFRFPATATFRLVVLAGFLAVAGCSEATPSDKRDDPALKASMDKSLEIYKSKMQPKKRMPASLKTQR